MEIDRTSRCAAPKKGVIRIGHAITRGAGRSRLVDCRKPPLPQKNNIRPVQLDRAIGSAAPKGERFVLSPEFWP